MERMKVSDHLFPAWELLRWTEKTCHDEPDHSITSFSMPNWKFSAFELTAWACLCLSLLLLGRSIFAHTQVQWHHAAETVKLRLKGQGELQLSQLCRSVTPPCFLNPFMRNSHVQTLASLMDAQEFPLYFRRMIFESSNPDYRGSFAVDFTCDPFTEQDPDLPPRTKFHDEETQPEIGSDDDRPMLVVLHGLCGGSHEQYLQHVLAPLATGDQKWESCVILSRGCGQSSISGGGMYYADATSDIRQMIPWIQQRFPNRPLFGAGFSMGANILTRYVAEEGNNCVFKAAVVISNPWNLETTALHLQRTFLGRWMYSPAMTANLMNVYYRHAEKIQTISGEPLKTLPVVNVKLLHEYDRYIQCPTWGFPTERAYYRRASSVDSIFDVRIPFWAINSEDDPIVGSESLPKGEFQASPYTVLCTTDGGGHLGWFQPNGKRWYAGAVVSFFEEMNTAQQVTTTVKQTIA